MLRSSGWHYIASDLSTMMGVNYVTDLDGRKQPQEIIAGGLSGDLLRGVDELLSKHGAFDTYLREKGEADA